MKKTKAAGNVLILLVACMMAMTSCSPSNGDSSKENSADKMSQNISQEPNGDIAPGWYNISDYEQKSGKKVDEYKQSPILDELVASGVLPPVNDRLPDNPLVLQTWGDVGQYGGTLQYFDTNATTDVYIRHINNINLFQRDPSEYYDAFSGLDGPSSPGIFESWDVSSDAKIYTFRIREGLKWSDGHPVTTEDVGFRINDVLLNKDLTPTPPDWLIWGGEDTLFEIIDTYSFRLTFSKPYGSFCEVILRDWPGSWVKMIYPKHYLMQFHIDYAEENDLRELMKEASISKIENWPQFFMAKLAPYGNTDFIGLPDGELYPTLNPYIASKDLKNQNWILERNPYFCVIDQKGNQLPYIDRLQRNYAATKETLNMNIIAGKSDLQTMAISLEDYPVFYDNTEKGNFELMNLKAWQDHMQIWFFNMANKDTELRKIYGDPRFIRAMSLAIDRNSVNETLFMGTGRPSQVAPRPGSPFYVKGMEEAYSDYDPEQAKRLLDEMGLVDKDGDGWRERLNGEPFAVKYDYFDVSGASDGGAELAKKFWEEVGVKTDVKKSDVGYFWQLMMNNEVESSGWWLGGSGSSLLQTWWFGFGLNMPEWAKWYAANESDRAELIEPPEWAKEMLESRDRLFAATTEQEKIAEGRKIWELQSQYLPIIGAVTESKTPVIYSKDLGNIAQAQELGLTSIALLDNSVQFYFINPERRK